MKIKNSDQEICHMKVKNWLDDLFLHDERVALSMSKDAPSFYLRYGSTLIRVGIFPRGEDGSFVYSMSTVVSNCELTPTLLHYLLEENQSKKFSGFSISKTGQINFARNRWRKMNIEGLAASVYGVAKVADEYDDLIISRFGGERAFYQLG